jgi:predicted nucleic acid-binding protein
MIVVADTTPINYLIQIGEIELLRTLFETVLLPDAVLRELLAPKSFPEVRAWAAATPFWVDVRSVSPTTNDQLIGLDPGEREAIQLALQMGIETVLIDETTGRLQAKLFNLKVRGTLGILEDASRLGKVDFRQAIGKLLQTNFRASPALIQRFLDRNS